MIYLSSDVIQILRTQCEWPFNMFSHFSVSKLHILIVASLLPDIIYLLFDVIQIDNTSSIWPSKVFNKSPVLKFQTLIWLLIPPVMIYSSSDVTHIEYTIFSLFIVFIKSPV